MPFKDKQAESRNKRLYYKKHKGRIQEYKKKVYALKSENIKRLARDYYHRNREKSVIKARDYRIKNKESVKQRRAARWAKNREIIRVKRNTDYAARKQELSAIRIAKYAANPDFYRAKAANYRKDNRERLHGYDNRRRALKAGVEIEDQVKISKWEKSWRAKRTVKCYWCQNPFSPKRCHTDHIVALTRGGGHRIENLCISCSSCNLRKNSKSRTEWNTWLKQPVLL